MSRHGIGVATQHLVSRQRSLLGCRDMAVGVATGGQHCGLKLGRDIVLMSRHSLVVWVSRHSFWCCDTVWKFDVTTPF